MHGTTHYWKVSLEEVFRLTEGSQYRFVYLAPTPISASGFCPEESFAHMFNLFGHVSLTCLMPLPGHTDWIRDGLAIQQKSIVSKLGIFAENTGKKIAGNLKLRLKGHVHKSAAPGANILTLKNEAQHKGQEKWRKTD